MLIALRLALLLAIVAVPLAGSRPERAAACSCAPATTPQALARSTAVFLGSVVAINDSPAEAWGELPGNARQVTLAVARTWKAPARQPVEVQTSKWGPLCGATFVVGESYLLFTLGAPDRLTVSQCSGALPLSLAGEAIAILDGRPPQPPGVGNAGLSAHGGDGSSFESSASLLAAVAVAAAAAVVVWLRRNRESG